MSDMIDSAIHKTKEVAGKVSDKVKSALGDSSDHHHRDNTTDFSGTTNNHHSGSGSGFVDQLMGATKGDSQVLGSGGNKNSDDTNFLDQIKKAVGDSPAMEGLHGNENYSRNVTKHDGNDLTTDKALEMVNGAVKGGL